jgi:alpha-tubulin suppressor-like RCC1 family protein
VSVSGFHTCAVTATRGTYCWGMDYYGQLGGGGLRIDILEPTTYSTLDGFEHVAAGFAHTCGIREGLAYCWGNNPDGRLGIGSEFDAAWPSLVDFDSPLEVVNIASGTGHTCAVVSDGVQCWGKNDSGQLGDGTQNSSVAPVMVGLGSAGAISMGDNHGCAIVDGTAFCWGSGEHGQVGNGDYSNSLVPAQVLMKDGNATIPMTHAKSISASWRHTCASVDGGAYCWGSNAFGELGVSNLQPSAIALPVTGLQSSVGAVATGMNHSCAVVGDQVSCWGVDVFGQLGDGPPDASLSRVTVHVDAQTPLTGASDVVAGVFHSCAIADGGVLCWGNNWYGQLGTGSLDHESYAVSVLAPGSGITELTAGAMHTCATAAGVTWCWGTGYAGRLGNGALGYSAVPVSTGRLFADGFDN